MNGSKKLVSNTNCLSKREGEIWRRLRWMSCTLSSNFCVLLITKARGLVSSYYINAKKILRIMNVISGPWVHWCLRREGRGYRGARSHAEAAAKGSGWRDWCRLRYTIQHTKPSNTHLYQPYTTSIDYSKQSLVTSCHQNGIGRPNTLFCTRSH